MLATSIFPCKPSISVQSHRHKMIIRSSVIHEWPPSAVAVDKGSLYEILRVKHNASQMEIKNAYRTLAKIYHPDATSRFMNSSLSASSSSSSSSSLSRSDDRSFIEIHNAYSTLSDPEARAVYDRKLSFGSQRWRPPMSGLSGCWSPGRARFNPTRRWETDQCW